MGLLACIYPPLGVFLGPLVATCCCCLLALGLDFFTLGRFLIFVGSSFRPLGAYIDVCETIVCQKALDHGLDALF